MKTIHKEYRVDKQKIGFIRFIFEGYDGVANTTTVEAKTGHIRLSIAPDRIQTAMRIIEDLKKDCLLREI